MPDHHCETRLVTPSESRPTLAEVAREVNADVAGQSVSRVLRALTERLEACDVRPSAALVHRYAVSISHQEPADPAGSVAV